MIIVDKMKSFLRSPKPEQQLAEIEAAIAAAQIEREQHQARRPDEIVAKMKGESDAAARVEAIDQRTNALDAQLRDLADAKVAVQRKIADEQAARHKREVEARPVRVAELRRQRLALVWELDERMRTAAAAMEALEVNGKELADVLDDQAARNFLHPGAFRERAANAFGRAFAIDPRRQLTALNNRLGIASHAIGGRAHWSIDEWEVQGLDTLALFFTGRAEAEAARDRLAARATAQRKIALEELRHRDHARMTKNSPVTDEMIEREKQLEGPADTMTIVPLAGGVFTLVPVENLFGERGGAAAAAKGCRAPMAIIAHEGGFALVPERFAGEAI